MRFDPPLLRATLLRRYKRFLADVVLDDGTETTAHCPNPGAMMGLARPGAEVWVQPANNPKRKLAYTWRLERLENGGWAGIDTNVPNAIVAEALQKGSIAGLEPHVSFRREVPYGENSRVDFVLTHADGSETYLEVKNVHLIREGSLAEFPDCVTTRGAKHLKELAELARAGRRAAMLYVVQMTGATRVALASDIDPAYAESARLARAAGVEMLACSTDIGEKQIDLASPLPVNEP